MPYGIHFVSRDESPTGFLVWRVASLAQDATEFSGEVVSAAGALEDLHQDRVPFEHLINSSRGTGAANEEVHLIMDSERSLAGKAAALVSHAQDLAAGKDPHDADVIAQLEAVVAAAQQLSDSAQGDSDQAFNDLTAHTDI